MQYGVMRLCVKRVCGGWRRKRHGNGYGHGYGLLHRHKIIHTYSIEQDKEKDTSHNILYKDIWICKEGNEQYVAEELINQYDAKVSKWKTIRTLNTNHNPKH